MLKDGEIVKMDREAALRYFRGAAYNGKGDEEMAIYCNLVLENPKSEPDDIEEAVEYIKKSADNENALGMTYYADILYNGITVPVNKTEAVRYYKKAIEKGCPQAMDVHATLLKDEGDSNSKKEALRLYKMTIEKEFPPSIYNYAMMLYNGDGIEQNKDEAVLLLEKAISTSCGSPKAMYKLDKIYYEYVQKDKKKAASLNIEAAEKYDSDAAFMYAVMLRDGDCVEMNKKMASKFFKKAADFGNPDAMFIYGVELFDKGTPLNMNDGIELIRKAANKGNKYSTQFLIKNDNSNSQSHNTNNRGNQPFQRQ